MEWNAHQCLKNKPDSFHPPLFDIQPNHKCPTCQKGALYFEIKSTIFRHKRVLSLLLCFYCSNLIWENSWSSLSILFGPLRRERATESNITYHQNPITISSSSYLWDYIELCSLELHITPYDHCEPLLSENCVIYWSNSYVLLTIYMFANKHCFLTELMQHQ